MLFATVQNLSAVDAQRLFGTLVFFLGCCIGSFMNVVIWRLPRGEKLSYPGSHCPNCGHAIRAWENIPILSWLFLRGRCSGCKKPISIRYPLGEAAVGVLYVLVYWNLNRRLLPLEYLPTQFFLAGALLAVAWIDVKHRMIPDKVTLTGIVVALLLALALPKGRGWLDVESGVPLHDILVGWAREIPMISGVRAFAVVDAVFGCLVGGAVPALLGWAVSKLCGRDALGGGDVKLFAMLGAFFGADGVVYVLLFSSLAGIVFTALMWPFRKRISLALPFGPFIALTAFVWTLFS